MINGGNIILPDGRRTKGPLYQDDSVRKVLDDYSLCANLYIQHKEYSLDYYKPIQFVEYVKYPRTYHLPWSEGKTEDDRTLSNCLHFEGKRVIVTEKMDGENFSGYRNYCHPRSVDGRSHYTRDWAKNFWMQRSFELPEGWRICAENLYAAHSIKYKNLDSYLYGFSVWDEQNNCLSWDETVEWFSLLNMVHVPVLYDGIWDKQKIRSLYSEKDRKEKEGYVVRIADSFHYKDFKNSVAKFVRANHVTSRNNWFYEKNHQINSLKENST
jgi:hypothetical protein